MEMWKNKEQMMNELAQTLEIKDDELIIKDKQLLRGREIDNIIYNAVFNTEETLKPICYWIIWEASQQMSCPSASIHDYYMARSTNAWQNETVPAINLRTLTYDTARTIFRTLKKINSGACIFEIAKSEMTYTNQPPEEFTSCVLAAAIKENYEYPVFIQGDHFQANAKNFVQDKTEEIKSLKHLIEKAIAAGFYNIDIDTSTLVELDKPSIMEQQRANYETAAELSKYIRQHQPKGVNISIGGEIGEVGGKNSTIEELTAFMEGFNSTLENGTEGISKISIQTGTSHGGVPLPDGTIAKVALDFDTLEKLGTASREQFHIGGVVQHGASTLPETAFDNFAKRQTLEVHLATGFQNIVLDSTALPKTLKEQIYAWLDKNCAKEKKADQTSEQFYYKTRKKALGPFKKELWGLTDNTKHAILSELAKTFERLFHQLGTTNSGELIQKFIKVVPVHKPYPKDGTTAHKMKDEEIPEGAD
ncbi:MAG: class II fructose-bisphosphate aldolase [Pseudomonadota bacterium]